MYLLDASTCFALLAGPPAPLAERLGATPPAHLRVASVTRAELEHAARRGDRAAENLALVARFLAPLATVPFDDRAASHCALIRADLERSGTPLGAGDLLAAATARSNDLTMVTPHPRRFAAVVGLAVEDWSAGGRGRRR